MQSGMHHQSSIREKLKSSICCFVGTVHHDPLEHDELCNYNKLNINVDRTPRSPTTPITQPGSTSSWFKKSPTASDHVSGELPRVRGRSLRNRLRRHHHHHHNYHRHSQSADFSYDPSSYALNFENESLEEYPIRNFSSRLPASPPASSSTTLTYSDELAVSSVPKEIVGYS